MSELRSGYTTGACAAAAAKAALLLLLGKDVPPGGVEVPFPDGARVTLPVAAARKKDGTAEAGVIKDAGDDPDITHGAQVWAALEWAAGEEILFAAGPGVGTVTKPGLAVPPGEPAINPGPRRMIRAALRELTDRAVRVTLSIPNGEALAQKTFNPRLGIVNGLSILGSTGRVRPFSCPAMRCSLICALDVARACGAQYPILVPGRIGLQAAQRHFKTQAEQVVEVGNEWGFILEQLPPYAFNKILILGHPGKLAKLGEGQWDTHSSRSNSAAPALADLARLVLRHTLNEYTTTEGIFRALEQTERQLLACALAARIAQAVREKTGGLIDPTVFLIDLQGEVLGMEGELGPWQ